MTETQATAPRRGREEAPSSAAPRMLASGDRTIDRGDEREFMRTKPIEPHEKFEIPRGRMKRGMSYAWVALKVPYSNLRSRRLNDFRAGGYQFARAEDFPELSGYKADEQTNKRLIELGIEDEVRPDDPVILDNLVLVQRPAELTTQAEKERDYAAKRQLSEHLQRQKESSERAIGSNRTQMSHTYGAAPEEAPSDASAEF